MNSRSFDSGKMERMNERHFDSPCIKCKYMMVDHEKFECMCPFFNNGVIPLDIEKGENQHTSKHPDQIKDGLFSGCDWWIGE